MTQPSLPCAGRRISLTSARRRFGPALSSTLAGWALLLPGAPALAQVEAEAEDRHRVAGPAAAAPAASPPPGPASLNLPELAPSPARLDRVEVTGSALPRPGADGALPVTVLDGDSLRRQGVASLEEALRRLPGDVGGHLRALSIGTDGGGASFANLRGLGPERTLVLLNGRRLAANPVRGAGVDLGQIPFALVERIELLRDGASALYGSDAVGGVLHIHTRRPEGLVLELSGDATQHGGAGERGFTLAQGWGDWAGQGVEAGLALGARRVLALEARQRDFSARSVRPGRGLDGSSAIAGPAAFRQDGASLGHPLAPACAAPGFVADGAGGCRFDTQPQTSLLPDSREAQLMAQGRLRLGGGVLAAEHLWVRQRVGQQLAGQPILGSDFAGASLAPGSTYFPGAGRVDAPEDPAFDPARPVDLLWRAPGPRRLESEHRSQRHQLSWSQPLGRGDFELGLGWQRQEVSDHLRQGYHDEDAVVAALAEGRLNPFGAQDAAGLAALAGSRVGGAIARARGEVLSLDARHRLPLPGLFGLFPDPARPAALALGAEWREERYRQQVGDRLALAVPSQGLEADADLDGRRQVQAAWGELKLPWREDLETTVSLRHDRYEGSGSATTPKLGLHWQAGPALGLRGSLGAGFRAPSLHERLQPAFLSFSPPGLNDPVRCPGGQPQPGADPARDCQAQFFVEAGGRRTLRPERARQANLGLDWAPAPRLRLSADAWAFKLRDAIVLRPVAQALADPEAVLRDPSGAIDRILTPLANAAEVRGHGLDLALRWQPALPTLGRWSLELDGTRVLAFTQRDGAGEPRLDRLGRDLGAGPIPRWQHQLTLGWRQGAWSPFLSQRHRSGHRDAELDGQPARRVRADSLWDLGLGWRPQPALELSAVLRNAFDRDPPYSQQTQGHVYGLDPRLADPRGRSLLLRLRWTP